MVYVNNQSQKSRPPSLQETRSITLSVQNSSFDLIHVLDKILCHLISFKLVASLSQQSTYLVHFQSRYGGARRCSISTRTLKVFVRQYVTTDTLTEVLVDLCVRWKVITPNQNMRTIQLYTSYPNFQSAFYYLNTFSSVQNARVVVQYEGSGTPI